jgi:hypothetical protein
MNTDAKQVTNVDAKTAIRIDREKGLKQNATDAVQLGKQATQAKIEEYQEALLKKVFWRSCLNCTFWVEGQVNTGCGLYRQMPPPKVIVHGCPAWEDQIPF